MLQVIIKHSHPIALSISLLVKIKLEQNDLYYNQSSILDRYQFFLYTQVIYSFFSMSLTQSHFPRFSVINPGHTPPPTPTTLTPMSNMGVFFGGEGLEWEIFDEVGHYC